MVHRYRNHGKSAFILQLQQLKALKRVKWAIFEPGTSLPSTFTGGGPASGKVGKSIDKEFGMTDYEMEMAYEFINNHFFYIYPERVPYP